MLLLMIIKKKEKSFSVILLDHVDVEYGYYMHYDPNN